ncbi:hypothetical protein JXB41_04045 [Candidatus Woesearchaeota archaeon]|nr:hypothetical protein [Candidatus Woesearchaeota archaeon]
MQKIDKSYPEKSNKNEKNKYFIITEKDNKFINSFSSSLLIYAIVEVSSRVFKKKNI